VARILIGVVAVLLVAHVVTVTIVGDGEPGWLARRFDMNGEYGFPAGFSALLLGTCGLVCFRLRSLHERVQGGDHWRWVLVGACMLFAAVDEAFMIHERAGGIPSEWFDLPEFLRLDWVVFAIPPLLLLAALLVPWILRLPRWLSVRMLLAAVLFVGGAVGVETISGQFTDTWGVYTVAATVEELLEMAGAILFLITLLRYWEVLATASAGRADHDAVLSSTPRTPTPIGDVDPARG